MVKNFTRGNTNKVLESVEGGSTTSASVSEKLGISQCNASNVLNRLTSYGHLEKMQINIPETGGRYFSYNITSSGKKRLEWLRNNRKL